MLTTCVTVGRVSSCGPRRKQGRFCDVHACGGRCDQRKERRREGRQEEGKGEGEEERRKKERKTRRRDNKLDVPTRERQCLHGGRICRGRERYHLLPFLSFPFLSIPFLFMSNTNNTKRVYSKLEGFQ